MKNLKNIATAITAVVLFATTATAQTVKTENANEPLTVKYIGAEEDYLVFQVEIKTDNSNLSLFKINDKTEGELFSQNLKANGGFKTFKIEKMDGQEISFKLVTGKKVYTKTFSATTSAVEKTTVNENDVVVL
jgi:hypothetical protein